MCKHIPCLVNNDKDYCGFADKAWNLSLLIHAVKQKFIFA